MNIQFNKDTVNGLKGTSKDYFNNYSILRGLLISVFFNLCANMLIFAQMPATTLVSSLDTLASKYPTEKIYVHTDKPYYALGDTIWFKVYTIIGSTHQPSQLSGAVYVDLIDHTDSIVQALKLPLIGGLAKGSISLSEEWTAGDYCIRAYTQWMRNAGAPFFYQEYFPLGSPLKEEITATASLLTQKDERDNKEVIRLHYIADKEKQSIVNKQVKYTLVTDNRFYTGEGVTSEDGDLFIDATGKARDDSVYHIRSMLLLAGNRFKQNFKVPIWRDSVEVAFFPEGGTFIDNLQQRIAVKVTDAQASGLNVQGEIRNSKNETVALWKTQHAGMGLFNLSPKLDESYHALIHFSNGSSASYPLPSSTPSGHTLSVYTNTDTDSVLIRLQSSANKYGIVHLLAQHNGVVAFSETINQQAPLLQLYVPKRVFSSGITQFTLFDQSGQPLAERIAFLQQADSIIIDVQPLSPSMVRDSVTIPLFIKGSTHATFTSLSVSVIDETRVPVKKEQENSIFSSLLLKSDLKGYIEQPGYYFTKVTDEKRDHLDLLMMTQGYRRFVWKAISQGQIPSPAFAAEPLLQRISGTLLTLKGKPVEGGKITLLSNRIGVMLDTLTDKKGRFQFDKLLIQDSLSFTLQGRKETGSNKVEIVLDVPSRPPVSSSIRYTSPLIWKPSMQTYLTSKRQDAASLGIMPGKRLLDEVQVTARNNQYFNIRGLSIPMKQLDHVIHPKASDSCKNLLECIRRWVPGITLGFVNKTRENQTNIRPIESPTSLNSYSGINTSHLQPSWNPDAPPDFPVLLSKGREMQLLYNGFPIPANDLNYEYVLKDRKSFDPDNITAIYIKEFSGTGGTLMDMDGLNTMTFLFIETKDGRIFPPNSSWDYALVRPQGYSMVREFYAPRYQGRPEEVWQNDWRTTIYWNPDLRVDKTGKATFGYFNANRPGTYRLVIEGLNTKGQMGRKTMRYTVKKRW